MGDLNQEQQVAVDAGDRRLACRAGPGAGKTRALIARIARLLRSGVHPTEILAITFTRKAAGEMRERLEASGIAPRVVRRVVVSTFHAWCAARLREFAEDLGLDPRFTIRDEADREDLIRFVGAELGLKHKSGERLWREPRVRERYHDLLREARAVDYDMLETEMLRLLGMSAASVLRARYAHVLVDEYQDTSELQQRIVDQLDPANLFVVGDGGQCQPAGSKVLTPTGWRPIEDLHNGDEVCGWDRRGSHVYTEQGSKVRVAVRPFSGRMYTVAAGGHETRCTPNHRWLVRWDPAAVSELHAVYVMRRTLPGIGECFRVGWCKVIDETGGKCNQHFKQRARCEKADAIWLVDVVRSRTEASVGESILSVLYALPTITFEPVNGAKHLVRAAIDQVWAATAAASRSGFQRLAADRALAEPHWVAGGKPGRQTLFEVSAAGLRDGMMVPVWNGDSTYRWEPVTVTQETVEGVPVYSLDVARHHRYVTDGGICTLNSIYGFRGASVAGFVEYTRRPGVRVLTLAANYRSDPEIVRAANGVAAAMAVPGIEQEARRLPPEFPQSATVAAFAATERVSIPDRVWVDIEDCWFDDVKYKDCAVLAPTWRHLEQLAEVLTERGIPHRLARRSLDLWASDEARWLIACLRVVANPHDHLSLHKALTARNPGRVGIGEWATARAKAAEDGSPIEAHLWDSRILDAIRAARVAMPFADLISALCTAIGVELRLLHLATRLDTLTAVEDAIGTWYRSEPRPEGWSTGDALRGLLDWYATRQLNDCDEPDPEPAVTLTTIHGAKGLEWPCVWVLGCDEGTLPRATAEPEAVEEARRLFYVATTRARDRLRWCSAGTPSRFVAEALGVPNV